MEYEKIGTNGKDQVYNLLFLFSEGKPKNMRSLRRMITLLMFLVVSAAFGYADTITYTFTGANGEAGTDWTLIDPSGYIPDDTPVVNLLTTSTDFFSFGQDYGPLIGIGDQG